MIKRFLINTPTLISWSKPTKRNFFPTLLRYDNEINEKESPLLHKLSSEFEDVACIAPAINDEELKQVDFEDWRKRIYLLRKYHFNNGECFKMIRRHPPLLKISMDDLENVLLQWRLCNLSFQCFQIILLHQPKFLSLDCEEIRIRIENFQSLYKSKKTLTNLLINYPNVMFDDWNSILLKIDYLQREKRVAIGEILSTGALDKSLDFIKLRFSLLEKCGIFKKVIIYPHKTNKFEKSAHKNPHLKNITDLDDETFSLNTAKISVEEYNMYNELFQNDEIDNVEDDTDDNDAMSYKNH